MISIAVISSTPTILRAMAITEASSSMNTMRVTSGRMPSASASSAFTVAARKGRHSSAMTARMMAPPT